MRCAYSFHSAQDAFVVEPFHTFKAWDCAIFRTARDRS